MKKTLLKNLIFVAVSTLIATIWWRGWVYYGVWGGPNILADLFGLDGENAYDIKWVEFLGVCLSLLYAIYGLYLLYRRESKQDK